MPHGHCLLVAEHREQVVQVQVLQAAAVELGDLADDAVVGGGAVKGST